MDRSHAGLSPISALNSRGNIRRGSVAELSPLCSSQGWNGGKKKGELGLNKKKHEPENERKCERDDEDKIKEERRGDISLCIRIFALGPSHLCF